jgi:hypothetical protein
MSAANCWTLFGFAGRFFPFRVSKIALAVFGSISMLRWLQAGSLNASQWSNLLAFGLGRPFFKRSEVAGSLECGGSVP